MAQKRVQKKVAPQAKETTEEVAPEASETDTHTLDDIDALLDEIDEVLEVNAEQFVRAYVQKGGE